MQHGLLPEGLVLQRVTDEFTAQSVPSGLMRSHRLAAGVWGVLRVAVGTLIFVREAQPEARVALAAGDALVIPPEVPHHVEVGTDTRFTVEFHR